MIRILGKGITAKAIEEVFDNVILYDDSDFELYDKSSNDITVVSPGIMPSNQMVKNANNLISEYDLFADVMPFSIWISGTNGKTTTTQMCQHLLEKKGSVCGGNIGTPLAKLNKNVKLWILETSSFTNYYTNKAKPNLYVLLPVSEDHITWHGSFEEYKKAKLKPLDFMLKDEIAIIPEEFKDYKTDAKIITYKNSDCLCKEFGIDKEKIKFKEPFLLDSLLALASSKIIFNEIDYELINSFVIDAHKVEEFYDKKNRLWIDDSKATNVDATINALKPYKDKKINLILGGDDKGANLKPLFEDLVNYDITIFAIGSNEEKIIQLSKEFGIESFSLKFLKNAVEKIDELYTPNSVGMLSPAAASLDQFTSYKHRGDEFKKLIHALS
ncbi:UDP-N-acetylmuramoyl-L-alanine--D-glutamate ligase [Arcobacter sp.]|uniref:UDP-N-acetylmuramoyl-L-alanine--D-glutamate ligase n=1 Tax=Arcobacter sp. TaxID=1872629 RepID=UPI003D11E155